MMREIELVIKRPSELEFCEVDFQFQFRQFSALEIDLKHINRNGRNHFDLIEALDLTLCFIKEGMLSSSDEKIYGEIYCEYFVLIGLWKGKTFKLVTCTCSDRPDNLGVITIYRTKDLRNESL